MDRQVAPVWSPSHAAAQREAKRRAVFYTHMNLWPFVAVLIVLLCIFMVNAPPFHHIALDLSNSSYATAQPKARAEDAMKVSIMRDGRVYFRNSRAEPESLPFLICNAVQEGAERKVYLAVDSRAMYRDAAAVVNEISKTGIREICFLANKREK